MKHIILIMIFLIAINIISIISASFSAYFFKQQSREAYLSDPMGSLYEDKEASLLFQSLVGAVNAAGLVIVTLLLAKRK